MRRTTLQLISDLEPHLRHDDPDLRTERLGLKFDLNTHNGVLSEGQLLPLCLEGNETWSEGIS